MASTEMPNSNTLKSIDRALKIAESKIEQGRKEFLMALERFATYSAEQARKARESNTKNGAKDEKKKRTGRKRNRL